MQEHGVPVTYAYISAAHEKADTGLGAGDPTYEQNLRNYDRAFGTFFNRLAKDGINRSNTLFVVSADENDHFVGAGPLNPGCNGITVPCHYDPNKTGNVEVALDSLLAQQGITTPFGLKGDSAPDYYLNGNPAPNDPSVRAMERAVGALVVTNPLTGHSENLTQYMADRAELNALHMVTSDPLRTPTFTQFELPDYAGTQAPLDCSDTAAVMLCPGVEVWNHGDIQPQITTTWLALVGPGVRTGGIDNKTWSDHTDIRPTLMALTGLRDDYRHDGRVLFELLNTRGHDGSILDLAEVYKQINAPVGAFGMATVRGATTSIESGSASDDSRYSNFDAKLTSLTNDRNALALKISNLLEAVAFDKANASQAQDLIDQAQGILARANSLAR
jgi:arylsulfatase A-like enzyme